MAATITTTTRFRDISVSIDNIRNVVTSISFRDASASIYDREYIQLEDGYPAVGTEDRDNLDVLQEIYGSDAGFLDVDGNSIVPTLRNEGAEWLWGTTVESLADFGLWIPYVAGSWEGYQDQLRIQGTASRGMVKHEGSGDTERIEQTIGHQVMVKQAGGDTNDFPLNRWNVLQEGNDRVLFSIGLDSDANLDTDAKLNAFPPIKAFLSYMERKNTSGDVIGTDILAPETFENRDFHIRQDPDDDTTELELTYASHAQQRSDDNNYIYVRVEFVRESSSAVIDYPKLSQLILGETGAISTTDLMIPPPQGSYDVPMRTSELAQDNHKALVFRNSGLFYRGRHPVTGVPFEVPVMSGTGLSYDFDELTTHGGIHQTPVDPFVTGVFFLEDSNDTLQFLRPKFLMRTPGHRDIEIHNHSDDQNLTLRLWGDIIDHVMVVYPEEYVKFQSVLKKRGAEELIGIDIPERAMEHSAHAAGNFNNLGVWEDDAWFLRPMRFGTSQNSFIHTDAFDEHSGSRPDAVNHGAIADYTGSWEWRGAWTVEMDGLMFVDYQYSLRITDASTNITGLNGPRLYKVQGSGSPEFVGELPKGTLTGNQATKVYNFNHVFRVEAGDLFFFMHGYLTLANAENIVWDNWTRKVELFPKIRRTT